MGKIKQDVCIVIGAFMAVWGIVFFAYYFTSKDPILSSEISLIAAIMLTLGGIIVMYIGDRSGRPSRIATDQ
jgi:preprotein translocase subunit SecY